MAKLDYWLCLLGCLAWGARGEYPPANYASGSYPPANYVSGTNPSATYDANSMVAGASSYPTGYSAGGGGIAAGSAVGGTGPGVGGPGIGGTGVGGLGIGGPGIGGPGIGGPGIGGPGIGGPFGFGGVGYPVPPLCARLGFLQAHIHHLVEPLIVAGVALVVFWLVKSAILPHLGSISSLFHHRTGRDGQSSMLDQLTTTVTEALASGVCLQRVACHMGQRAKGYGVTNVLIKRIGKAESNESLINIFKKAATGEEKECARYTCKKDKASPT